MNESELKQRIGSDLSEKILKFQKRNIRMEEAATAITFLGGLAAITAPMVATATDPMRVAVAANLCWAIPIVAGGVINIALAGVHACNFDKYQKKSLDAFCDKHKLSDEENILVREYVGIIYSREWDKSFLAAIAAARIRGY
jgi:hypothetical protein